MSTLLAPRRSASPFTHKDELSALKLVQSSVIARRLAKMTVVLLVLAMFAMLTLPWQQSARGTGKVTAYIPQERRQSVMSPVKGVVERVAEGIVEGSRVEKGQFIVEIAPQASDMAEQLELQIQDLKRQRDTAAAMAESYGNNVKNLSEARDLTVEALDELVKAAEAKLAAKQKLIPGYEAKERQAVLNYERHYRLATDGAKSRKQVEILSKDALVAEADLESALEDVTGAERELAAKRKERQEKEKVAQTKVDYAMAMQHDAMGKQASITKDIRSLEIKQSEMERMIITAPRDGTIFRMPVFERGMTIKEGTRLFDVVPETSELVVELWLAGNDVPLVRVGDHVRLQFEGWPAIQFAGWPSVAVGTFGGHVAAIDETDDGTGKFRVQVRPEGDDQWPSHRFLRQGVRANGWVMLQRVRLGYEIWRQLNGFPPVVAAEEPASKMGGGDKEKKPKLPKS